MRTSKASTRAFPVRIRILRSPPIDTGTGSKLAPATIREDVPISHIDPVGEDAIQRFVLETPVNMYQAFTLELNTFRRGDIIEDTITAQKYDLKHYAEWPEGVAQLILEKGRVNG